MRVCCIKKARFFNNLELFVGDSTSICGTSKTFDKDVSLDDNDSNTPMKVLLEQLKDDCNYQSVEVDVKVIARMLLHLVTRKESKI